MSIELSLETAKAVKGVDREALIENVKSELQKIEKTAEAKSQSVNVSEERTAAPAGAQGVDQIYHWGIHFLENPALAGVYARGLVFAVNELLLVAKKAAGHTEADDAPGFGGRLKVLGSEIKLPATQAAIAEYLKGLDAGG